jgi:transposase
MKKPSKYAPEVRERAVRMVREHQPEHTSQWAAIESIAAKIGCTAQTLCNWVRQSERDAGERAGLSTTERDRLKALERENPPAEAEENYYRQQVSLAHAT